MQSEQQTRMNFSSRLRTSGKHVALAAFSGLLIAAAPLIQQASVSPAAIAAGTAETVLFTAAAPAAEIIPASVNLQRNSSVPGGFTNVGQLYDDGTHGDGKAGDGVYSLSVVLNEPAGTLTFRVSAAARGSLGRVFSDLVLVRVGGAGVAAIRPVTVNLKSMELM